MVRTRDQIAVQRSRGNNGNANHQWKPVRHFLWIRNSWNQTPSCWLDPWNAAVVRDKRRCLRHAFATSSAWQRYHPSSVTVRNARQWCKSKELTTSSAKVPTWKALQASTWMRLTTFNENGLRCSAEPTGTMRRVRRILYLPPSRRSGIWSIVFDNVTRICFESSGWCVRYHFKTLGNTWTTSSMW